MEVEVKRKWERSLVYHFEPKEDLTIRVTLNRKIQNRGIVLGVGLCALFVLAGIIFSQELRVLISVAGAVPIFTLLIYSAIKRKSYFTVEEVSSNKTKPVF
jgi:hypothetical protein